MQSQSYPTEGEFATPDSLLAAALVVGYDFPLPRVQSRATSHDNDGCVRSADWFVFPPSRLIPEALQEFFDGRLRVDPRLLGAVIETLRLEASRPPAY